jgi:hypothetical protein
MTCSAIMLIITLPLMFVLRSAHTTSFDLVEDTERHAEGKASTKKGLGVAWRHFAWIMLGKSKYYPTCDCD